MEGVRTMTKLKEKPVGCPNSSICEFNPHRAIYTTMDPSEYTWTRQHKLCEAPLVNPEAETIKEKIVDLVTDFLGSDTGEEEV